MGRHRKGSKELNEFGTRGDQDPLCLGAACVFASSRGRCGLRRSGVSAKVLEEMKCSEAEALCSRNWIGSGESGA